MPFDWRMVFFPMLLLIFYLGLNLIIVSILPDQAHIYDDFDWFHESGFAIVATFAMFFLLSSAFAIFWLLTQKCKLPRYQNRKELIY